MMKRISERIDRAGGFTVIELLVVVAVIAIVSSIAIPKMMSARLAAHETSAIATLKAIMNAQAQTQSRGVIDTDVDGAGEFAYLAEMTGDVPARVSAGGAPGPGMPGIDELEPSALLQALGSVQNGCAQYHGYMFQLWLPGPAGGAIGGIPEDLTGGKTSGPYPDPNTSEQLFCVYAWPREVDRTGQAAFFINQQGLVLRTFNRGAGAYSGTTTPPGFDAAFTQAGDMSSPLALNGLVANDSNLWVPVQ